MNDDSSLLDEVLPLRIEPAPQPIEQQPPELLLDSVPALIAYVDAAGRYKWVNQEYQHWYGFSSEEFVGRPALDVLREVVGADYAEQVRPGVEKVLAGCEVTFEATHHVGGRRHDLLLSYRPDRCADGAVRGFIVLVTDITAQKQLARELKASNERFTMLAQALPSVVWTAAPDGRIDYLSNHFYETTGLTATEGLGSNWLQVIHPEDVQVSLEQWGKALKSETVYESRYRVRQLDGSYRWYLARGLPLRDDRDEVLQWVGVSTDIHRLVTAEESVRESERRYRLLFEDNPIPMLTYHTQTLQILSANDIALQTYGCSREEFLRMRVSDIRPAEELPRMMSILHDPPHGTPIGPSRHRRKDGSEFWVEAVTHSLSEGDPAVRLVVIKDVSEQVRLNEELVRRAEHDALTGLPNRSVLERRFQDSVEQAKRSGKRIAILAIDLDRFKQVNDTFGHHFGDDFLRLSADRLLSHLRTNDTLARFGGDEFVAMVEGLDSLKSCAELADRLSRALNDTVAVRGAQLRCSVSIGMAIYPDDGEHLEDMLRRADFGLYDAKRAGKACWKRHSKEEKCGVQEALEIERCLRKAISEGRLELHYQPIYSRQRELVKLEALVRLPHPELGLLSPARFIPIAEESGLISGMGLWVQLEICRQIRAWRGDNIQVVPIAVNVSAAQFRRGSLADDIANSLRAYDIHPGLFEVELTESVLMENTEQSLQQLRLLKQIGVRIAVDDFGTGYSSLSYLHWFPLDSLKIDRSFVQTIKAGGPNPIVQGIVDLGRNLGVSVVAEGVETEEQFRELRRMKCGLLQGFLFGHPAPAHTVVQLLQPDKMKPVLVKG